MLKEIRARLVGLLPRRRVSQEGIRMVAAFEDFRSHPYRDVAGVWTIGYGETKGIGPDTRPWSQQKAWRKLRRRLNRDYAPPVRALGLPLTQPMFDALVSFVYNLGPGAIAPGTGVGRALRARRWQDAADEMLKWDKADGRVWPGLSARRRKERALFLSRLPRDLRE
jgi:lysozyme